MVWGFQDSNEITVYIPERKIAAIIGPSGSGKTTLLRCFNRLIDLEDDVRLKGSIFVDEEDVFDAKVEVKNLRKKMGLLFQKPQGLPISIYDNVAYGQRIHGIKYRNKLDEIVEHYLKETSLWEEVKDRLNSPAHKLYWDSSRDCALRRDKQLSQR
ncbi:MAG: phosphate ABC transporter ATP-binding protein [Candidatus Aminicenantia bacterium]